MIIENEKNEKLEVKTLFTFKVKELNKEYIAYTINTDNQNSKDEIVFISEIDINKGKIKSIEFKEKEIVLETYQKIKNKLLKE